MSGHSAETPDEVPSGSGDLAALGQVLATASRVSVVEVHNTARPPVVVNDPVDVRTLVQALTVNALAGGVCMCRGDVTFEFRDPSERLLASAGLHHGVNLRWDGWTTDAVLADGGSVLAWLVEHGIPGPLAQVNRARAERDADADALRAWRSAVPPAVEELGDALLAAGSQGPVSADLIAEVERRLTGAYPSPVDRALTLLRWSATGTQRCSGAPEYEFVPTRLLARIGMPTMIAALRQGETDPQIIAGATRHLVGWHARENQQADIALLPSDLHAKLQESARESGDHDKAERAKQWLGDAR